MPAWMCETIVRKLWFRSDRFWVSNALYRDPIRRIPLALDTWVLMQTQYWPRERIDALAEKRIADIVRRTQSIPLFAERYAAARIDPNACSKAEFERLPFLTKQDLYDNDASRYSDVTRHAQSHVDHTSGSTGTPLQFLLDWRAELRYFAVRERMFLNAAGGKRLPVVYFRSRINPGFFFGRHHLFRLKGFNDVRHRIDAFIDFVSRFRRGFVLYGYASSMVELARRLTEKNVRLPLRAIVATGEGIREADRDYIESALHTKFYLTYATWEVKWIALECEFKKLHIHEEYVHVEIVDDDGRVVSPGTEGRIAVTSFESESMPFIRYLVGDRGAISEAYCACGRTSRTLTLYGRQSDIIELPNGRVVPLFDVSTAFDTFASAVRQYRIVQTSRDTFTIQVVPGPRFEEKKELLTARLIGILDQTVRIEWHIVGEIEQARSGKAAYFVRRF